MEWQTQCYLVAREIKQQMIEHSYGSVGYILKFNKDRAHMYGPCPEELPTVRNDNERQ